MISYRKAIRDDIGPAFDLVQRVFLEYEASISDAAANDRYKEAFACKKLHPELWNTEDRLMYVALDDDTIIGMAESQGNGHISSIYIDGAYHRRGIGTELLSRMICELKLSGFDRITLDSPLNSFCFFTHFGFKPIDIEKNADGYIRIPMSYEPKEIWDVLDEQGNKTGRYAERGRKLSSGDYHLVVHVWKRNKNGEWLIDKRVPRATDNLGGKWETTGGSAVAGDDSLAAALRETREELGIDLDPEKGLLFRRLKDRSWFADVWVFEWDGSLEQVRFQKSETCEAMWASPERIREMMRSGDFLSEKLYPYFDEMVEKYRVNIDRK